MKKSVQSVFATFLTVILVLLLSVGFPWIEPLKASPQNQNTQPQSSAGGDPCGHLPDPPGNAFGIDKKCPTIGNSAGIAKGDFNGDGIADLAIGIPGKDVVVQTASGPTTVTNAGAVQIIYGTSTNGLVAPSSGNLVSILITESSPGTNHQFGSALAAGDFNRDGVSDLAVGIPGATAANTLGRGAVQVFKGNLTTGLSKTPMSTFGPSSFYVTPNASPSSSHGAYSLSWGDFNGDGVGDLAVASDYSNDGYLLTVVRSVTVLFGTSGVGLTTTGKTHFEASDNAIPDANNNVNQVVVSAGDFDGDGLSDLVAAFRLETVNGVSGAGAVHILYGTSAGPSDCSSIPVCHIQPQRWTQNSTNVPGNAVALNNFGAAVAAGDFNQDGAQDLAVGVPNEADGTVTAAGSVIIIHGVLGSGLEALTTGPAATLRFTLNSIGGVSGSNDNFGLALAANDFNGDKFADLAIGVPNKRSQSGLIAVIYGSAASLSTTLVHTPQEFVASNFGQTVHAGDRFGASLSAWNFGKTTHADLAIAAPFTPVGTATSAGSVIVVYGSSNGLVAGGSQIWNEGTPGLGNRAVSGDTFGLTLY